MTGKVHKMLTNAGTLSLHVAEFKLELWVNWFVRAL